MDIDLDWDYDRIGTFLQSKLDKLKSKNVNLEESLRLREQIAKSLQQEVEEILPKVQVTEISKKIFFDKYVLLLDLRNESETILKNINVLLDWSLSSSLSYKFFIIPSKDVLKTSDSLQQLGKIVVVFDIPAFALRHNVTINGSIIFQQDCKKTTLKLPSDIELTPQDVLIDCVISENLINGSVDDFLTCAFASEKYEFVTVIPANWTRLLETALEIDCSLYRLNSEKKMFLVHKLSPLLDGTLLELEDEEFGQNTAVGVNIYSRNESVLLTLLNLLHSQLKDVQIVPRSLYNPELSYHDTTELIKDLVINELNRLEGASNKDLIEFRASVAELEHETDVLVARIKESLV